MIKSRKKFLGVIMAGGKGTRLYPLTKDRAKPAVPIGGKYRIIDFVLSNFVNSGIYSIYILTQFKAQSLLEHLRNAWNMSHLMKNYFITPVPAQMRIDNNWYRGTADALYQNLHLIDNANPDIVAVFGGDHIYKMDISQMINYHIERNALLTVAALPLPINEAKGFGIIEVDKDWRIIGFEEKPENPKSIPGNPGLTLVSMGNYMFNRKFLIEQLVEDASRNSKHDFGIDILPRLCGNKQVFAYDFRKNKIPATADNEESYYWRDIGTIDAYYEVNMDLRSIKPQFNLYNKEWPIHTAHYYDPPAKFVFNENGRMGIAVNSIVCEGDIISGGLVQDSVLGRNVFIHSYSEVKESILMEGVDIGRRAKIKKAIIDKNVKIPPDSVIGYDLEKDRKEYFVTESGIVVIPKESSKIPLTEIEV
jgi:glucose-1-phosphate adenylyltransferase